MLLKLRQVIVRNNIFLQGKKLYKLLFQSRFYQRSKKQFALGHFCVEQIY